MAEIPVFPGTENYVRKGYQPGPTGQCETQAVLALDPTEYWGGISLGLPPVVFRMTSTNSPDTHPKLWQPNAVSASTKKVCELKGAQERTKAVPNDADTREPP